MNTQKYVGRVNAFNAASGSRYIAEVNFLKFRTTSRGILVGHYAGKTEEIAELNRAVERAGAPYYTK